MCWVGDEKIGRGAHGDFASVYCQETKRKNERRCGHVGKCFVLNELWPKQNFSYGQIHRNSAIR